MKNLLTSLLLFLSLSLCAQTNIEFKLPADKKANENEGAYVVLGSSKDEIFFFGYGNRIHVFGTDGAYKRTFEYQKEIGDYWLDPYNNTFNVGDKLIFYYIDYNRKAKEMKLGYLIPESDMTEPTLLYTFQSGGIPGIFYPVLISSTQGDKLLIIHFLNTENVSYQFVICDNELNVVSDKIIELEIENDDFTQLQLPWEGGEDVFVSGIQSGKEEQREVVVKYNYLSGEQIVTYAPSPFLKDAAIPYHFSFNSQIHFVGTTYKEVTVPADYYAALGSQVTEVVLERGVLNTPLFYLDTYDKVSGEFEKRKEILLNNDILDQLLYDKEKEKQMERSQFYYMIETGYEDEDDFGIIVRFWGLNTTQDLEINFDEFKNYSLNIPPLHSPPYK